MRISIALCTYNGEQYLQEQLDSILKQTRLPDEVIVCDDRSSDRTWDILRKFKEKAQFEVQLIQNDTNLGSTGNFAKAISLCSGDLIFLADQDDVWVPSKLKIMEDIFEEDQDVGMVFSDAVITNEQLHPYSLSLWESVQFDKKIQDLVCQGRLWSKLFVKGYVTGATMAFRSKWRPLLGDFPPTWFHDEWITFIMDIVSKVKFVPEQLIQYRIHDKQQLGVRTRKINIFRRWRMCIFPDGHRGRCKRRIDRMEMILARILVIKSELRDVTIYDELVEQLGHWKARYNLPKNPLEKWKSIRKEMSSGRYQKYSGSNRMAFKDLIEK